MGTTKKPLITTKDKILAGILLVLGIIMGIRKNHGIEDILIFIMGFLIIWAFYPQSFKSKTKRTVKSKNNSLKK